MHGGVKVYRGAAAAARAYVEADRSRADDYYLAEGTGLARRFGASPDAGVEDLGVLDGDVYECWVAGHDPVTGQARGRLRGDGNAVRFVEVTVNGPKTWSLAAALNPEVAAAYDAAQDRAAGQVIAWVAAHATTRVGPRGRQVQVPVERVEAVTVRHYTSRAGDPHRHLHLQFNARVFAAGGWRGLHTVGFRDSLDAVNGIGHAAMATDPGFRTALADAGFTLDPGTGEIRELAPYVSAFSARAAQIARNIDRYEAQWRTANPGQEPGPGLRQAWDRRAWKQARPDQVVPTDGADLTTGWTDELHTLGYHHLAPPHPLPHVSPHLASRVPVPVGHRLSPRLGPRPGQLDREAAVEIVLSRLGARRSAWNGADVRGEVEKWIAATGVVADAAVRTELAEDLTARVLDDCTPLLRRTDVPEHVRAFSSDQVLAVEADLITRLAHRAQTHLPLHEDTGLLGLGHLAGAQLAAATALAGTSDLLVLEGAAGAGKTTTLKATAAALTSQGHRMVVATPTLKAAQVATRETGTPAVSVAWLVHRHGYRWDPDGRWTRLTPPLELGPGPDPGAVLRRGDLLVVDEAGMLDQDSALALLTLADEAGARVAMVGDRHQLPAVGRGGVLDLAHRWAHPASVVSLEEVHRFADPEYAAITLAMRRGLEAYRFDPHAPPDTQPGTDPNPGYVAGELRDVFETLWERDQIRIYPTEAERTHALAELAATHHRSGHPAGSHGAGPDGTGRDGGFLMVADTREQTTALAGAIRDRLIETGHVEDQAAVTNQHGERIGVGDRVTTRRNDRHLGVANRDTWTVTALTDDGYLHLAGWGGETRAIPGGYATRYLELAYATTVYGTQGETTETAHLVLGEHTSAASAYVAMTRGRHHNIAHLVATNVEDARRQWEQTFSRDRADLGPTNAAHRAAEDIERYGPNQPRRPARHPARPAGPARPPMPPLREPTPTRYNEPPYTPPPATRSPGIGF